MTRRPWGPITWMVVPALAALQLVAPVVAGLAPAAHAATAGQITLRVRSARTVNAADPGTPQKGDPVLKYSWLIAAEDVGNPRYSGDVANCTPKDADGTSHGAAYQPGTGHLPYDPTDGSCQWPSTRYTPGNVPVVAEGDQADFAPDASGFATKRLDLPAGRYLVSVTADGYKIDGAHFDVAGDGSLTNVVVDSQPLPVPLGTVRLRVFQDTAPVDGTYEVDIERPLAGFTVHLSDVLGEVTTDFYGQPLCTVYQHDGAATAANPEGTGRVSFDDGGAPIVFSHPGCRSDATGDVAIPNLGADRYAASVIAPSGQSWYQTTTLEGAHDWDIWTSEGDTGLDTEQTVGGEPVPAVDMGFVPHGYESDGTPRFAAVTAKRAGPRSGAGPNSSRTVTLTLSSASAPSTPVPVGSQIVVSGVGATSGVTYNGPRTVTASDANSISYVTNGGFIPGAIGPLASAGRVTLPDAGPAAFATSNSGEITGTAVEINTYVGGTGGVTVPNAGVAGANVRGPVDRPVVTLSDLGSNDQMVYVGRGKANGSFDITNVPDGSYQLTLWDEPQNMIIDSFTVDVAGGKKVDVGQKGLVDWFAEFKGTIFVDTDGDGKRDPGEQGVPKFTVTLRERDNSLLDQGQNIATTDEQGNYTIRAGYPLSRWAVLEAFDTRYMSTGVTVQADNEPDPTTYLGAGVDISVLPVIGLSGRVDWGVKPYSGGENGGIVGTVSYDTTRNELDPAYSVAEDYQPGIPGMTLHLRYPVRDADGNLQYNDDGSVKVLTDAAGEPLDIADPYTSESWEQPSGCTARQHDGSPLTDQSALPAFADEASMCVEAPMAGWQAVPSDKSDGAFGQTVNGNYGFGETDYDPDSLAAAADGGPAPTRLDSPVPLANDDYVVTVDLPKLPNGRNLYEVTKEEDVNVFQGDTRLPQENFPPTAADADVISPDPGQGGPVSQGNGFASECVGANHTVDVSDQTFLANGGSPYQGLDRHLCDQKLVTLRGNQAVAPTFTLFTPVPLPTHFWGLTINDLGLSQDKTQVGYGEAQPLPHVPMGIYDWTGRLVDTVQTDYNGMYEALEPSTSSYNCPLPAGPCPGMYYFKGNDPGQPGHANKDYNPRFRTIGTNFQAWPGLFTVTDTAPTQVGVVAIAPGSTQINPVQCDVSPATPQLMRVSTPYLTNAQRTSGTAANRRITIEGTGFGATQGSGSVTLAPPTGTALPTTLPATSWSATSITVTVPQNATPGARQLAITAGNGNAAVDGLTLHLLGGTGAAGYTPTLVQVNPPAGSAANSTAANTFTSDGTVSDTNPETVLQRAVDRASALPGNALLVVWPNAANDNNPTGDYFENVVVHDNTKIQGVGPGGFQDATQFVAGSRINGLGFNPDSAAGTNWVNTVTGLGYDVETVPDAAVVTVLGNTAFNGAFRASLDGMTITGGSVSNFPTNIDTTLGGTTTPAGGPGALISQGGGVYLHGRANNMAISNNVIVGNSGSYGGGIRVGTPYTAVQNAAGAWSVPAAATNSGVSISHNRIRDNGGTNLAGGVALFDGSGNYTVDHNDLCGNFSAEYGGGISHYGLSGGGSITANRIYLNQSYDEGGGVMVAGELNPNLTQPSAGSGQVTIDANLVQDNLANDDGGGVRFLQAGNDRINVTNNIVTNNVSTHEGGGFALDDSTNVRIVGNTVMKNLTTATAATSNGKPAPAGLSTATNSDQLQATLSTAGSTPRYSKPLLVDNIFSDNRAGTWDPAAGIVRGIGATGDSTAPNVWDMGSLNPLTSRNGTANLLSPTYSLLSKADPQVTTNATDKIGQNPGVVSAYDVSVRILTSRAFPTFREAVIVANAVAPDLQGNYHLGSASSPAANAGNRTSLLSAGLADVYTLMGHDVDAQPRATGGPSTPIDIGADEIP